MSEAINTFPSLVKGLGVRKGTTLVVPNLPIPHPSVAHTVEWTTTRGERLLVSVSAAGVVVADCLSGASYAPTLLQHFPVNEFIGPIKMRTYAPFFFGDTIHPNSFTSCVVGESVYVAVRGYSRAQWSGAKSPATNSGVLISIEDVTAGTVYGITLSGINTFVTAPTPLTSSTTAVSIAETFRAALVALSNITDVYTVTRNGAALLISRKSATDTSPIDVAVSDSTLGRAILLTRAAVASADLLPTAGVTGFVVVVKGLERTTRDDYWVQWVDGVWVETVAPNSDLSIDPYIMPWVLKAVVVDGVRSFQFGPIAWHSRDAGDDTSNPLPQLNPIDLLFVAEQRLGMTSGGTIALSATGDPTALFRKSVSQLLASDPTGGKSAVGPDSQYHTALVWNNDLYLWNDRAQFKLDPNISAATFGMSVESHFENSPTVPPIVVGSRIYYVRYINGATRVYEYWRPPGYNMPPTVTEITESIPTYLQGAPTKLTGDEALGFLGIFTADAQVDTLYVCHFSRDGNGAIQPRWHTWRFHAAALHAIHMVAGRLMLLLSRAGVTNLEALDVANPADTASATLGTDVGGAAITPMVEQSGFYVRDDKGAITQGRFMIRNLTIDHQETRMATLRDVTQDLLLYSQTADGIIRQGTIRIPLMRLNDGLTLRASWVGFLTGLHIQGTFASRSKRL